MRYDNERTITVDLEQDAAHFGSGRLPVEGERRHYATHRVHLGSERFEVLVSYHDGVGGVRRNGIVEGKLEEIRTPEGLQHYDLKGPFSSDEKPEIETQVEIHYEGFGFARDEVFSEPRRPAVA